MDNTTKKIILTDPSSNDSKSIVLPSTEVSKDCSVNYKTNLLLHSATGQIKDAGQTLIIEQIATWFLHKSSMSNKKLQKLCYYAYSWFIVFNNDLEDVKSEADIISICPRHFEAWIHGPVFPSLYRKYRPYGWHDIPKGEKVSNDFSEDLLSLLQQIWDAYGSYTADELEAISHGEDPWINARRGLSSCQACSRAISNYDILKYYSNLD